MNYIQAIILAIIEGLTEFLPVSSTGHMIIGSSLMGIASNNLTKVFTIVIQFGCILSVVFLYFKRFFQSTEFYFKLLVGFLPAVFIGFLLNDFIDSLLENVTVVAIMLLIGGIFFLYVDKLFIKNESIPDQEITYKKALLIGFMQCIAMVPGVSRSAASIIGGLSQGLNRKTAAEFSFFLAVPTMFAATVKKMYDYHQEGLLKQEDIGIIMVGNVVAFIVGALAIKFFIGFLTKHGFRFFGYYRIILGTVLLILLALGYDLQII
jgi:undecaprenyl-diphosphatase